MVVAVGDWVELKKKIKIPKSHLEATENAKVMVILIINGALGIIPKH